MKRRIASFARPAARLAQSLLAVALFAAPVQADPGDTFEDPFVVGPTPVLVTGTTCGFTDDVADLCQGGAGSPDVFYRFTPDHDGHYAISTCGSWFFSNLVLYDRFRRVLRCRQSTCLFGGYDRFLLAADSTYYIAVEGEYGACGRYVFSIDDCPDECSASYARCIPEEAREGEPSCDPGYVDHFNDGSCTPAGCNVSPVPCTGGEVSICGTAGFSDSGVEDTDAYEFVQESASQVTIAVASAHASLIAILVGYVEGRDPELLAVSRLDWDVLYEGLLERGRYVVNLHVDTHGSVSCDNPTVVRFTGVSCTPAPTSAKQSSWGALKATYR